MGKVNMARWVIPADPYVDEVGRPSDYVWYSIMFD